MAKPKVKPKREQKAILVWLDIENVEIVKSIARSQGRSLTGMVRNYLTQLAIKAKGKP